VSVDGSIPGCSCQIFTLSIRNVFSISLDVSLREAEIDQKYLVAGFVEPDAEVIRLYVSMDEVPVVNILDSGDHLVGQH